jgi:isopentenyl phosphate kinase
MLNINADEMDNYLIKIGGSTITNIRKANTAKPAEIKRIFNEIKPYLHGRHIIVGHGSGSFAHIPAHKYKVNQGMINPNSVKGASITQDAAARLHRIVLDCAVSSGVNPLSFAPSSGALSKNGKIAKWDLSPMKTALSLGFLPITYGDVVVDSEKGFSIASTEEVFRHVSSIIKPKKIIIGTDVDGIFDSDPKLNNGAKLIKRVDKGNINEILNYAGSSTKVDVTGGMKSKLKYLYNMSRETGAACQIINIAVPGNLAKTLKGNSIGTKIKA